MTNVAPIKNVEIGLQVRIGKSRIEPVGVVGHGVEHAGGSERGEGVAFNTDPSGGRNSVQHARFKDVRSGVDEIGRRLARRRLFHERDHSALGRGWHHAKARRVLDRMKRNGRFTALRSVKGQKLGDV